MTHISDKSVPRHRALVALFYECATSTEINPALASALEQVITEIHAQGRNAIEALQWYVLDMTGAALDALDDMVLEQKIDGLTDFPAAITPMIRNIRRWITIEKSDQYGNS